MLIAQFDARVSAFNERGLDEVESPFVYTDAVFIKCRNNDRVASKPALIASGVNNAGYRKPFDVTIGDSESLKKRKTLISNLVKRCPRGIIFVVSDEHGDLVQSLRKHFAGATRQRCQVHLQRNLFGTVRCESANPSPIGQSEYSKLQTWLNHDSRLMRSCKRSRRRRQSRSTS